jgi:hypothetical protein
MDEKQRSRRDFWQNIAIVALSLSAVFLFSRTQLYTLASSIVSQQVNQLLESPVQTESSAGAAAAPLSAPVHVAVSGAYGRFGNIRLVTSDDAFRPLGDLLNAALGSARTYTVCSEGAFLEALNSASVYYDFLTPLPFSILAGMTGADTSDELQARHLILSDQGDRGVQLYIQDADNTYRYCTTAVSRSDLINITNNYELGNAIFAYELAATDSAYGSVEPCSLFLTDVLTGLPALRMKSTPSSTDHLLSALSFNPRTNYRYPESDGTEVIVEGERSLRIRPNGMLLYRSSGESALTIEAANPAAPTLQEAASGVGLLLRKLQGESTDRLYLLDIRQNDTTTVLQFGYHANGIPIRFSDDACAAEITLDGNTIVSLDFRFRQYEESGESAALLPPRQALAIAAANGSTTLSIGYADTDSDTLQACWLTE